MAQVLKYGYFLFHPQELRNIIQWYVWHNPVHTRNEDDESIPLRHCFNFLDQTSRSFSAVIKELNPELLVPICIFYLVLRGLDTVEDDMTIPIEEKDPLLRDFYNKLEEEGWTYDGNHVKERDRNLLVNFHYVITEFKQIKPEYQVVVKDIAQRMGAGMADFAGNEDHVKNGVQTIKDYELYCHYVAGLVGEGLTRLFVSGNLANSKLLERRDLQESMGQFLQQTNVIRDVKEDRDEGRSFWPKEVWSKYVTDFDDLFKKENRDTAMRCSSELILLALERAPDCLFYLAGVRDQSVFNFAAIPQAMAVATLELCFRNPALFERNVKIRRGDACRLMIDSSQNLQILYGVFKKYARLIHKKNDPRDPNFLKISAACGRIEQFVESIFPTQDPKTIVRANGITEKDELVRDASELAQRAAQEKEAKQDAFYVLIAVLGIVGLISLVMLYVAHLFGARFDLVFLHLKETILETLGYTPASAQKAVRDAAAAVTARHQEL